MSSYSMTLQEVLATLLAFSDVDVTNFTTKQFIEEGRKKLFNFEYPIFDPTYKAVLETNFIRNFYMREIGFETHERFQFELESWLLINMRYFNKLFESELMEFDPLVNSKMDTTSTRKKDTDGAVDSTTNGNSTSTQNSDGFNRFLESDTPDNRLAITTEDGKGIIQYASKINEGTSKNNVSGADSSNVIGNTLTDISETETYVQSRLGKTGSVTFSKMMNEYRNSLIRVEVKMFEELQKLFMLVY